MENAKYFSLVCDCLRGDRASDLGVLLERGNRHGDDSGRQRVETFPVCPSSGLFFSHAF